MWACMLAFPIRNSVSEVLVGRSHTLAAVACAGLFAAILDLNSSSTDHRIARLEAAFGWGLAETPSVADHRSDL